MKWSTNVGREREMKFEDIKKIGIVGAGTMGHGIAINYALAGYPTVISDVNEDILKRAMSNIRADLDLFVEEELVTRPQAAACIAMKILIEEQIIAPLCILLKQAATGGISGLSTRRLRTS